MDDVDNIIPISVMAVGETIGVKEQSQPESSGEQEDGWFNLVEPRSSAELQALQQGIPIWRKLIDG